MWPVSIKTRHRGELDKFLVIIFVTPRPRLKFRNFIPKLVLTHLTKKTKIFTPTRSTHPSHSPKSSQLVQEKKKRSTRSALNPTHLSHSSWVPASSLTKKRKKIFSPTRSELQPPPTSLQSPHLLHPKTKCLLAYTFGTTFHPPDHKKEKALLAHTFGTISHPPVPLVLGASQLLPLQVPNCMLLGHDPHLHTHATGRYLNICASVEFY